MYTLLSHGSRIQVAQFFNFSDTYIPPDIGKTEQGENSIDKTTTKEKPKTEFQPHKISEITAIENTEKLGSESPDTLKDTLFSNFESISPTQSEKPPVG